MVAAVHTAPPLIQGGLFDRRTVSIASTLQRAMNLRLDACRSRLLGLRPDAPLQTTARIVGVSSGGRPRR